MNEGNFLCAGDLRYLFMSCITWRTSLCGHWENCIYPLQNWRAHQTIYAAEFNTKMKVNDQRKGKIIARHFFVSDW